MMHFNIANYSGKYGRRRSSSLCSDDCRNFHVCLSNVASAIRVFDMYKRTVRLKKTQKILYDCLKVKFQRSVDVIGAHFISLKYYILKTINENLELMRVHFLNKGNIEYAIDARSAIFVDFHVNICK